MLDAAKSRGAAGYRSRTVESTSDSRFACSGCAAIGNYDVVGSPYECACGHSASVAAVRHETASLKPVMSTGWRLHDHEVMEASVMPPTQCWPVDRHQPLGNVFRLCAT